MSRREEQNRSRSALLAVTSKGLEILKQGPAPPPPLPPPISCYEDGDGDGDEGSCSGAGGVDGYGEPVASCERQLNAQSKRKEKARIAARARRGQEASIIMDMAMELHITQDKLRRIDKATIIKLGIDYIKAYEVLCRAKSDTFVAAQQQQQQQQLLQLQEQQEQRQQQQQQQQQRHQDQQDQQEQYPPHQQRQQQLEPVLIMPPLPPLYPAPKLSTASIFAPKTSDNCNEHFLMIEEEANGKSSFILKPDTEILEEDDLTHLAPQAGDSTSISFETDPLDGIQLDDLLTSC